MSEYFLNNVNVYDASDDTYIVFLVFRRCAHDMDAYLTSRGLFSTLRGRHLGSGAVSIGCFQFIAYFSLLSHTQRLLTNRWGADVAT